MNSILHDTAMFKEQILLIDADIFEGEWLQQNFLRANLKVSYFFFFSYKEILFQHNPSTHITISIHKYIFKKHTLYCQSLLNSSIQLEPLKALSLELIKIVEKKFHWEILRSQNEDNYEDEDDPEDRPTIV